MKHEVDVRIHSVELSKVIKAREDFGWELVELSVEGSEWTLLWEIE